MAEQIVEPLASAIKKTEQLIRRQRAIITERAAGGKPVDALRPVLSQIEGNLAVLGKVQIYFEEQRRRMRKP